MLDFDHLASVRAKSSNEEEARWRAAIWSGDFQIISKMMSDGEVETVVNSCGSAEHLEHLTRFLIAHSEYGAMSPFSILTKEAKTSGLGLGDWVKTLSKVR